MILKLCNMAHKICPNITPELKEKFDTEYKILDGK